MCGFLEEKVLGPGEGMQEDKGWSAQWAELIAVIFALDNS